MNITGCLFLILLSLLPCASWAQIAAADTLPQGFEVLAVPRRSVITVSYGGSIIGNFPAHVMPAQLQFDDVDAVLAAIPAIKDISAVKNALTGTLPTHADLICQHGNTEECGTLTPEIAGVIFDDNHLSAEIFISKNYLSVTDTAGARYLPLPQRRLTSVYNFDGAINGGGGGTPDFTLGNNAVVSFGEGRFASQSSLTNKGLRFDSAAAIMDREGIEDTAGLFRSRSMQLLPDRDIAGVSVSTSMNTRLDHRKIEGNAIILFLAKRSIVSIFREGRLYSSRSYSRFKISFIP